MSSAEEKIFGSSDRSGGVRDQLHQPAQGTLETTEVQELEFVDIASFGEAKPVEFFSFANCMFFGVA